MDVFVLGAGSSKPANGPLISEFKARAAAIAEYVPGVVDVETRFEFQARLHNVLRRWDRIAPEANLEEYYVLIDLLTRLGYKDEEFESVRELEYLIYKTLERSLSRPRPGAYERFVERTWKRDDLPGLREEPAVITLNWDILMDNAIAALGGARLRYGTNNARLHPKSAQEEARPRSEGQPFRLLKLHGSLNWLVCPTCRALWYAHGEKIGLTFWEGQPWACGTSGCTGSLEPLIIPPMSQKIESPRPHGEEDAARSHLAQIWKTARDMLVDAKHLYIIGYSFPSTDVQFRMFLTEALSRKETRLERIAVVTSPKHGSQRQSFEDAYSEVFRSGRHFEKLWFYYGGFEDWVEDNNCLPLPNTIGL